MALVQRFDSGMRLDLHFHVLWLDGVYASEPGRKRAEFCEHVRRVLVAMGLSTEVLVLSPARGPPRQRELQWE